MTLWVVTCYIDVDSNEHLCYQNGIKAMFHFEWTVNLIETFFAISGWNLKRNSAPHWLICQCTKSWGSSINKSQIEAVFGMKSELLTRDISFKQFENTLAQLLQNPNKNVKTCFTFYLFVKKLGFFITESSFSTPITLVTR